jgi:hypothetical protein
MTKVAVVGHLPGSVMSPRNLSGKLLLLLQGTFIADPPHLERFILRASMHCYLVGRRKVAIPRKT